MRLPFVKYHALRNDFLVMAGKDIRLTRQRWPDMVRAICDRRSGIGADGVLRLSSRRGVDLKVEICNADGSWAEKSGNGMRIAVMHHYLKDHRRREFRLFMDDQTHVARIAGRDESGLQITTTLGQASFETGRVPVRSRHRYMINAPLKLGGLTFPVTCLSVGNPHTVLLVDDFDFDWRQMGSDIETHRAFPNQTNVEFVRVLNRKRLRVAEWERGAGATGSSGTGAAAAVCAAVMLGVADRSCEVQFDTGSLHVYWNAETKMIELTGPVELIGSGNFEY